MKGFRGKTTSEQKHGLTKTRNQFTYRYRTRIFENKKSNLPKSNLGRSVS